jgi:hypothetical protein
MNQILKYVSDFLLPNGFEFNKEDNTFINDFCSIEIQETGYAVCNNNGEVWYSGDHNIYSLIGYLTYYGYMSKNYLQ